MNREPRVGDVEADAEPRPRPTWLLPAIVGIGGFAFGLLVATTAGLFGPSEASPTLPPVAPAVTPTSASAGTTTTVYDSTTTSMADEPTLGERVPGFEGTLYFADPTSSQVGEPIQRWSSEMSQPVLTGFGLPFMGLDAGGARMAVLRGQSLDSPYQGGVLTLFGGLDASRAPELEPEVFLGSGVVGFRWHAVRPGSLAWVEYLGADRWSVNTADFTVLQPTEPATVTELDRLAWPLYWDDDVIVLLEVDSWEASEDAGVQIVTLSPNGRRLGRSAGEFAGRLPTGELAIVEVVGDGSGEQYETSLTNVALDERREPAWLPAGSWVRSVVGSPDGERAFIHVERPDGQALLRLPEDGSTPLECDVPSGWFQPFWSFDSEWIIAHVHYGMESHLEFLDPESCSAIGISVPDGTGFLTAVGR